MDPLEYLGDALPYWDEYLLLLAVSAVLHWWLLLKRRTLGFFDPLFFVLVGSVFGWAIVWFMAMRGDIDVGYALSFTAAELAFYLGLELAAYRGRKPQPSPALDTRAGFATTVFVTAALVHAAATLTDWSLAGVPLLRASRLGAFIDSGGLGVIERLVDGAGSIALFSALYLLLCHPRQRGRWLCFAFLAWYALTLGLSGSKSAFLAAGQCAFAVAWLYSGLPQRPDRFWGGRTGKLFIAVSVVFATLVLAVQQEVDLTGALIGLAYRLVNYGDIYILAYPNAAIEGLTGSNPIVGLFGSFLSTFRLFPVELVYPNIGYQFTLMTFPDLDYIAGPNPRHPVFGYHYFGAFGFVFSFLLGLLTSRLQRALYFGSRRTYLGTLVAFLAYSALSAASGDFELALTRLASAVISLCLVLGPALALYPRAPLLRRSRGEPTAAPASIA